MSLLGAGAVERIGVDVVANTGKFFKQVDGAVGKATGKFGGLAKKLGTAVKAGALVGGVAIAGLGTAAIKMGIDFEKSIAEVKTLLPDLDQEGFGKLKSSVLDLSKEMGIATDELVPALYQAISAGVPPENVIDFLRVGAKASIGGVTDLSTAVDGLTTITNAWGLESDKAGEVADVMFTGVKLGKTTMGELSDSMFQAAPLASALGISVQEVVAATATLTKSGVPTSIAMTSMRQAMVGMSKPTADMTKLLEKTGFASGEALIEAKGFTGAIDALTIAADNDKEVMAKAFGSVEALGFVLGVSGDKAAVAAEDLALVTDSAGAADEAFKTMDETVSRKLAKAINILKVELTKIGIKVLPTIAKALTFVTGVLDGFMSGFERFNDPDVTSKGAFGWGEKLFVLFRTKVFPALKAIADFVVKDFFPAFMSGVEVVAPLIEKLFGFIIDNKPVLIAAIAAIGLAILLAFGPGAIAIAAIIGLIALIGVIKDNWEKLEPILVPIGIALGIVAGVIFATMIPALIGMAAAGIAAVAPWLLLAAPIIAVVAAIALVVFGIRLLIKNFDKVKAVVKKVISFLKKNAPLVAVILLSAFLGPLPLIIFAIIKFRRQIVGFFKGLPGEILAALQGFGILLLDIGRQLLQGLLDGILLGWEAVKFWHFDLPLMILAAVGDLAPTLLAVGEDLLNGLLEGATTAWESGKEFFSELPGKVLDLLKTLASLLITLGKELIGGLIDGVTTVWEREKRFFSELPGKITEAVGDLAALMINLFLDGLNALGDLERDFARAAFDLGRNIVEGLEDGVTTGLFMVKRGINALISIVESGLNFLIDQWNALEFKLPKVDLGPLGSIGGGSIGTPNLPRINIPRLQRGGFLGAGQVAMVNEGASIEFFRPFSSGTVLPIAPTGAGGGAGRWTNYGKVINIHGAGRRTTDVLRDLNRQVAR